MARGSRLEKLVLLCLEKLGKWDSYFANPYRVVADYPATTSTVSPLCLKKSRLVSSHQRLRLTQLSKINQQKAFLLRLAERPWDGYWRVVVFDIPETQRKKRDLIRRELYQLGFRLFQRSVWISLLPVKKQVIELLTQLEVGGKAIVFETREFWAGDKRKLIERLWKLTEIKQRWEKWFKAVKEKKEPAELIREFFDLVAAEPSLPQNLLGADWPLYRATHLYRRLIKLLGKSG